ncbi:MAG: biotin transporter BioY [Candidatus Thermoplasmatota archaeon]
MSDGWTRERHGRMLAHERVLLLGWPFKVLLATGFAGFIALAAQVSIPLPWTPVPFSFQPLAVLVTGTYLGRNYGLLSVALYLLAGALGLHVFADQESSGLAVLSGYTAGYLFGFGAAAYLVGWYVERSRRLLDQRWALGFAAALGAIALASFMTLTWIAFQGGRFESSWSATRTYLWLFVGMAGLAAVAAAWLVRAARGQGREKLNLFLVMMAATALVHVCGVAVLKPSLHLGWSEAVALGSTVFLPFDLIKAALATAAAVLFLPQSIAPPPSSPVPPSKPNKSTTKVP